ncbi:hypothetical protein RGUI_0844 [Rhodovulum sp. P5]|uniref:hypothetical protein n=1 Tax=Rhodovulum phage vB_RhkS_P1 TaxID=1873452 RepID=UPI00080AABCE|nr:hypothetical protein [Rhodovulum sp. P5]YP_009285931.1 hypothetical protein BI026_gp46 [Rhodovulum phage vB_RhkS_P1]ANT39917.1 hypothetical protein Rhks_46 [Rhodovulum phage vB_RhkS_P1]ARE38985.1 hypothetical protein RGUI_0844 [Rhodovulum sp. P5]
MAQTGADRDAATRMARAMQQDDAPAPLRLPASERPLIELALATVRCWIWVAGLGGMHRVGLDLVQVEVVARWRGIVPDARLLDGLQIIERAVLRPEAT